VITVPPKVLRSGADSKSTGGKGLTIGLLLLSSALTLALLRPLLTSVSLAPHQTLRVYFEPSQDGTVLMLNEHNAGYITDLQIDSSRNLEIPAGRTIAIALERGSDITLRTRAHALSPYIVLGTKVGAEHSSGPEDAATARVGDPVIMVARSGALEARRWDSSRPWTEDREWLHQLRAQCSADASSEASVRMDPDGISVHIGSCAGKVKLSLASSEPPLLVVVTGPHAAVVSKSEPGWRLTREFAWPLIAVALLWVALLAYAIGAGPTVLAAGILFATAQFSPPAAILCWAVTLPFAVAAAAGRLVARLVPRSARLAWAGGAAVLILEICGIIAAIAFLDVGTFGHQRITREGDSSCSVVGYSTVRGDSLREGSAGIIERLSETCAPCRNRTSRFSREAQTLRWVRKVICSPSFPTPTGGDVIFFGGGNDDLFYRPTGLVQLVRVFAGTLRFRVQPIAATDWEAVFDYASQTVVPTLDEQAADIDSIVHCATAGRRRFFFLHDFLIWDLDRGRTPARQLMFERRRAAVRAAGGEFIDLLGEFRQRAGVTWLNDFIHPSAVGQQMIADLLCARLESNPPAR
jgi:hypothetical protein